MEQLSLFTGGRVGKVAAADKGDFFELDLHGPQNFGNTMTDADHAGAAGAVDVALARRVPDANAFDPIGHRVNLLHIPLKDMITRFHFCPLCLLGQQPQRVGPCRPSLSDTGGGGQSDDHLR